MYQNGDVSCSNGKHDFVLDEEVGLKCRYCSYVSVEIRDVSPTMDKYRANISDKKTCSDKRVELYLTVLILKLQTTAEIWSL
uniref:Uncharacterized protein n=1 Tax=Brassica oleracea TaxID=3712 RepID=A0A3P6EQU0_BRAOL|nr:unnamed protein product [Brassica oleracea]